jgi:hypothetical protein
MNIKYEVHRVKDQRGESLDSGHGKRGFAYQDAVRVRILPGIACTASICTVPIVSFCCTPSSRLRTPLGFSETGMSHGPRHQIISVLYDYISDTCKLQPLSGL